MKKISVFFLSENFQFLEVKFSIYSNRRVFVMIWFWGTLQGFLSFCVYEPLGLARCGARGQNLVYKVVYCN